MTTTEARTWRAIGKVLWSICEVERGGARVAKIMQRGIGLTPAERARLDQTLEEEAQHMVMVREIAVELRPTMPPADAFEALIWRDLDVLAHVDDVTRFAWALAVTQWNERYSVRRLAEWQKVFAVIHPELGRRFATIQDQERGHVAWGEGVIERLAINDQDVSVRVQQMLAWTRRVYPPVIHASHGAAFRHAKALARG